MNEIVMNIRIELEAIADEQTRQSSKRFFKEAVITYGVKSSIVKKIGKDNFALVKNCSKEEIFEYCEQFFQSGYLEESFFACDWSYNVRKQFQPQDFRIFERWIENYVTNWATCDTFCNHTMGAFLESYPEFLRQLKEFTSSTNRWMRRAAAVSLIIPARRGKYLEDILEIADMLLPDKDDMVQKGYGWMLKAASQAHQQEVFDFVMLNKKVMPRTALRYAIEKMPPEMREQAIRK